MEAARQQLQRLMRDAKADIGGGLMVNESRRTAVGPGQRLALRRQPENRYDALAIEVLGPEGHKLGYVPRRRNEMPARLMDAGKRLSAPAVGTVTADTPPSASPRSAVPAGTTSAPAGRDDARREALGLQVVAARAGPELVNNPVGRAAAGGLAGDGGRRLARPAAPRPLCPSPGRSPRSHRFRAAAAAQTAHTARTAWVTCAPAAAIKGPMTRPRRNSGRPFFPILK